MYKAKIYVYTPGVSYKHYRSRGNPVNILHFMGRTIESSSRDTLQAFLVQLYDSTGYIRKQLVVWSFSISGAKNYAYQECGRLYGRDGNDQVTLITPLSLYKKLR